MNLCPTPVLAKNSFHLTYSSSLVSEQLPIEVRLTRYTNRQIISLFISYLRHLVGARPVCLRNHLEK